ncbi:hypothetical protein ABZ545_01360 [Streptomyces abikoensis]|uniref:hypothetical protein n=1 Tax=Streptomyces abikoensis TaxID=97398 RepID=UPI00340C9BCD
MLSTLVDNFNDNITGSQWGNYYGGVSEVGGRARVPCTNDYAGYQSAYQWTLANSSVYVQVPTVPGASTSTDAYCAVLVNSPTTGTRIGFTIKPVTNVLRMQNDVGYFDASAVEIAYSATNHRWLRIREDGTNVYWDTAPDGSTWTNRRTLASPGWIATSIDTCALDLSAHRDGGTGDYAEYDYCNTLSDANTFFGSAALASDGTLTSNAVHTAIATGTLTGDSALTVGTWLSAHATASLTGDSSLAASFGSTVGSDMTADVGLPVGRWRVGGPWR